MKYIKNEEVRDADGAEDAQQATGLLEARLHELRLEITELPAGYDPKQKGEILIQTSAILVDLERGEEAFSDAREAFDIFKEAQDWEALAQTCNNMFMADQPESLPALGQGIWVGVTFPEIDPELTVALLQHVVNETPPESDGAALAAAVERSTSSAISAPVIMAPVPPTNVIDPLPAVNASVVIPFASMVIPSLILNDLPAALNVPDE